MPVRSDKRTTGAGGRDLIRERDTLQWQPGLVSDED